MPTGKRSRRASPTFRTGTLGVRSTATSVHRCPAVVTQNVTQNPAGSRFRNIATRPATARPHARDLRKRLTRLRLRAGRFGLFRVD